MTARREISRQEFLKITGRAAAGAAVGSTLLLQTNRTEAQIAETALITDFGARGNGVADDTAAIHKAINAVYNAGGGTVKVPATEQFYRTTRAIDLRSDIDHRVRIVGEGSKSFIKNVATSGGHEFAPVFRSGLLVAGSSIRSAPGQTYRKMARAEKGATVIKPVGGTYKRGQMLLISGGGRVWHGNDSRNWYPLIPQIVIVKGVDSQGVHLMDPLLDDHPNSEVAIYPYGVSYGGVSNLRFEQQQIERQGFAAVAGGGAYRMTFKNLQMTRGVSVFAINGFAHCLIDGVHGRVTKKGFELARYSHSTTVKNSSLRPFPGVRSLNMQIFVPECSHRCVFEDCHVDARGMVEQVIDTSGLPKVYGLSGFTAGGRYNVLRRCTQLTDRFEKAFSLVGNTERQTIGNRIEDSTIIADNAGIILRVSTPGVRAGRHVITHNRIQGRGAADSVLLVRGTTNSEVTNNIAPQGVRNLGGTTNKIENNTAADTPTSGPR